MKRVVALLALMPLLAWAALIPMSIVKGVPVPTGGGDDGWAARSAASGVTSANRLDTQTIIDDWKFADGEVDHLTLDTSIKPAGAAGSLKIAVLNADTSGSGFISVPFGATYGQGDHFWVSYRVYCQPDECYAPWPPAGDSSGTASKWSIISIDVNAQAVGTYHSNEIVIQTNYTGGQVDAYRGHSTQYDPFILGQNDTCSSSDIRSQPSLDRGASPLTGNNPDTGSAWTACEQLRGRYGLLYYWRSSPGAPNYALGLGDPFSGGFREYPGEWVTITTYVRIGTWGSGTTDSRVAVMAARGSGDYELLLDVATELGGGNNGTGTPCISNSDCKYTGINLLPYTTGRQAGGRQVSANTGELAGCFTVWNVSPSTPTGSATLSYNASTQKFTFTAPGDSAGTARGFSAANNFLAINVLSSTVADYINGLVIPAGCPGSGTTTATLTIATNRPNTQRNYSDVISSTNPINAPNGNAPPISLP